MCSGTHWKQNSSRRPETLPGTQKKEQADNTTHSPLSGSYSISLSQMFVHTLSTSHSLSVWGSSDWLLLFEAVRHSLLLLFLFVWCFFVSRVCKEHSSELDRRVVSAEELGPCRIRSKYRDDTGSVARWSWGN